MARTAVITAIALALVCCCLRFALAAPIDDTQQPSAIVTSIFLTQTRVNDELQNNLTITGQVVNPLMLSEPVRVNTFSDSANYTIEIFVQPTVILTRRTPIGIGPELSQDREYTHCDASQSYPVEPADKLMLDTAPEQENDFANPDTQVLFTPPPPLANVSTGFLLRRLLSEDDPGNDNIVNPGAAFKAAGSDQPSSISRVLQVANTPCESAPLTSYAVRARNNCMQQVKQHCTDLGTACPWTTPQIEDAFFGENSRNKCNRQLVAPPNAFVSANRFLASLPLQPVARDQANLAKIVPTAFCEFGPRDAKNRTADTEGDSCRPACTACTSADWDRIDAMGVDVFHAEFSDTAVRALKAEAGVRFIDDNGNEQQSLVYFETAPGDECKCSPRTAQFYRVCAMNPWVEPDYTGEVQKCVKAFTGFICMPIRLASLRRDLSPTKSFTTGCDGGGLDLDYLDFLVPAPRAIWRAITGRGYRKPCNRVTYEVKDDRARAYEVAEAGNNLSDRGQQLNDVMAGAINATQGVAVQLRHTSAELLALTLSTTDIRNNQSANLMASYRLIEANLELSVNRSLLLRTAAQALDQTITKDFTQVNQVLGQLVTNSDAFISSASTALNFTRQQIALLQQGTGLNEQAMIRLGRLVSTAQTQADLTMEALVDHVQGRDKYNAVVKGTYSILQRTREQDLWVPLVSEYARPQSVLPPSLRSFVVDVQLTYAFTGTRLVQHEMQLECSTASLLRLNVLSLSPRTMLDLIGPVGCNITSELKVACYCVVHVVQRSCQLIPSLAASVSVAAPSAFIQALTSGRFQGDQPLQANTTAGGLCVAGTTVVANISSSSSNNSTGGVFDDFAPLAAALETGMCQNTSFVATNNTIFRTFYTVGVGNDGASVGSFGHSNCSLDPQTLVVLFAGNQQLLWLDVVLQMWVTALQQRTGSQFFALIDELVSGGLPQIGLTFRAYAFGRPPDSMLDQPQPPLAHNFDPDPQTAAEELASKRDQLALLAPLFNVTLDQLVNATGTDAPEGALDQLLQMPQNYSTVQSTLTRLEPQNCVEVSFMATGMFAMPHFLTELDPDNPVLLRVHARIVEQRPLNGSAVNATNPVEQKLNADLLSRNYSAAVIDETMDFGKIFAAPSIWVGYAGCAFGTVACQVPRASVAALFDNSTEFYMYDPSNNDLGVGARTLPALRGTIRYAHLELDELVAALGAGCPSLADTPLECPNATNPAFLFDNLTQIDACMVYRYYGAGCRIPMFLIKHLFQQQGLDPNLPQSNVLGFNPVGAAVNPDTIRVRLVQQRIQMKDSRGVTLDLMRVLCTNEDTRQHLWCRRMQLAAIRLEPEFYDGETNPDRWTRFAWTPWQEVIRFTTQVPAFEVARYEQAVAQRLCPYWVSLDAGRNATEWILRVLPPAFDGALNMTLIISSQLGADELFTCDGQNMTLEFNSNDNNNSSLYREFLIPNCHVLHLALVSGAQTCWSTDASNLQAAAAVVDIDGQQAAAVDRAYDESENRVVVALQAAAQELSHNAMLTRQALIDEAQRGLALLATPSLLPPPSLDPQRAAAELAIIAQLPNRLVNDSLAPAWQLSNVTALADLVARVEDTIDTRLAQILSGNRPELAAVVVQQQLNQQSAQSAAAYQQAIINDVKALDTLQFLQPLVAAVATGSFDNLTDAAWECLARMGAVITSNPAAANRVASRINAIMSHRLHIAALRREDTTYVVGNPFSLLNPSLGGSLGWARAIVWSIIWSVIVWLVSLIFICAKPCQCCSFCERLRRWMIGTYLDVDSATTTVPVARAATATAATTTTVPSSSSSSGEQQQQQREFKKDDAAVIESKRSTGRRRHPHRRVRGDGDEEDEEEDNDAELIELHRRMRDV